MVFEFANGGKLFVNIKQVTKVPATFYPKRSGFQKPSLVARKIVVAL